MFRGVQSHNTQKFNYYTKRHGCRKNFRRSEKFDSFYQFLFRQEFVIPLIKARMCE